MEKLRFPDEEQLEELLREQPEFDLAAVKRRTMERIAVPARRRPPLLRGLLAAVLICAMSASALAAADLATNGRVTAALGLRPAPAAQAEIPVPAEVPEPEEIPELPPVKPEPVPQPEPEPEPPVMDTRVREALQLTEEQAERLRPAVQQVDGTSTCQDITMTVEQMTGDRNLIYIQLRFDFPEELPMSRELKFRHMDFGLDSLSWNCRAIHRTDRSVTCLLTLRPDGDLAGRSVTLTVEDFGYEVDRGIEGFRVTLREGIATCATVDGEGSLTIENENLQVPEDLEWENGYASAALPDGRRQLWYDGSRGKQILYLSGGDFTTADGQYSDFEVLVPGTWSHTWTVAYQDLSVGWSGEAKACGGRAILRSFRISPLSWEMTAEGDVGLMMEELHRPFPVTLVYADGRVAEVTLNGRGTSGGASYEAPPGAEDGWYVMTTSGSFETMPDLTGVTAVIYEGQTLALQ
ncbi:hypothetical protein [Dysosmobacter sp.]|uniref:hypothetical protein n=1 Tax=Dysosmobacter sp. TaxID=2591382 RepID=UPI002A873337|nr:hypothetical protein [Dysosmobacter sp.]MDY3280816.1 hypothetical protein [Dysosmobacter sp.]